MAGIVLRMGLLPALALPLGALAGEPVPSSVPKALPDAKILNGYVGYYRPDPKIDPDHLVEISLTERRFTYLVAGHTPITLVPRDGRRFTFYAPASQSTVEVTFEADASGRAARLITRADGVETVMDRIDVKTALEISDRATLNAWFATAPGRERTADPGVPALPTWILIPRTATSIPFGTAVLDKAPGAIATIPLGRFGYVEEEYFVSGTANIYTLGAKSVWRGPMPYTTRILVRRPREPKTFSGTIHMEPLRDLDEASPTTQEAWPYFVRNGDVFVAWTMAKGNVPALLQKFDAERYGALHIPANGLRWDMMAQVAWLLRSPDGLLGKLGFTGAAAQKTGGLRVYSTGTALTAEMQAQFINEGFHARARTPQGEPVIDGYMPVMNIQRIPPQDDAFIMRILSESEFLNPGTYEQPGAWVTRPAFRGQPVNIREYHVASTSHLDRQTQAQFGVTNYQLGLTQALTAKCLHPIADTPGKAHVIRALYSALETWVRDGKAPPPNRLFLLDSNHMPVRDAAGNVVGSLRPTWINIPTARFAIDNQPADSPSAHSAATCKFHGYQVPFTKARLVELYQNRAGYLERVAQHLNRMVQQRYILREEAEIERKLAEGSAPDF